jgi:hypothetical protein
MSASKSSIFWGITPCPLKANLHFGETCCLYLQGRRISQPRNQHEAGSKHVQRTTRRYIPEDRTLHNFCCENLKSGVCFVSRQPCKTVALWVDRLRALQEMRMACFSYPRGLILCVFWTYAEICFWYACHVHVSFIFRNIFHLLRSELDFLR